MARPKHPTLHPSNWQRSIEAHVPRKVLRDQWYRLRFGPQAPRSDECIYVDPRVITHQYDSKNFNLALRRQSSGMVRSGDWDQARVPVDDTLKMRACRMRWNDGADWSDTPIYARHMAELESGHTPDGLRSRADLDARCAALDAIYQETKARGRMLARHELPDVFRREAGGILVHIARDGTVLRTGGGAHRFAIARLLELPEMPAQLGVIHALADFTKILKSLRQSSLII